jgi:hypothetical protein
VWPRACILRVTGRLPSIVSGERPSENTRIGKKSHDLLPSPLMASLARSRSLLTISPNPYALSSSSLSLTCRL